MVTDLTEAEQEALMDACPVAITPSVGDHDDLFAVVESIKVRAAAEALRAAADDLTFAAATGPYSVRFRVMQRLRTWADHVEAAADLSDAGGRVEP